MGVILDSSVLIAGERGRESVDQMLDRIGSTVSDYDCALSAVTVVEMTHGIYRARNAGDRDRRRIFCETLFTATIVHPPHSTSLYLPDASKVSRLQRATLSPPQTS